MCRASTTLSVQVGRNPPQPFHREEELQRALPSQVGIGLLQPMPHQLNISAHQGIQAAGHPQKQQPKLAFLAAGLQPAPLKAGAMPANNVAKLILGQPQLHRRFLAGIGHKAGIR